MKTLMIKDLTASTELDGKAMAAVAGGSYYFPRLPLWEAPSFSYSRTDIDIKTVDAKQDVAQLMNVDVATGINTAFADHITSNVDSYQEGSNNINVF
jgi:hypothetical protein